MTRIRLYAFAAFVLILLLPRPSSADSFLVSGTASTTNQSMWSAGSAFILNANSSAGTGLLTVTSPDLGPGISCLAGLCGGGDAFLTSSAGLNMNYLLSMNSGSVNVSTPLSIPLDIPNGPVTPGQNFSVGAGTFTFNQGSLDTTGSNLQAAASLSYAMSAGVYGQLCTGTCGSFGSATNLLSIGPGTQSLFTFNVDNNGIATLGDGGQMQVGGTYNLPGGAGSLTTTIPSGPDTAGGGTNVLSSTGSSSPASFFLTSAALPNSLGDFPTSGSYNVAGFGLAYNLPTVELGAQLNIVQSFTFTPTATLFLDVDQTGQVIQVAPDSVASILFPKGDTSLEITPELVVSGTLNNTTSLCVNPFINVAGLGGTATIFGTTYGTTSGLFNYNSDFGCSGATIYNNTFNLGGFQTVEGQSFEITATPEPDLRPWACAAFLVAGFTCLGRRLRA